MVPLFRTAILGLALVCLTGSQVFGKTDPVQKGDFTYYFDHPHYLEPADSTLRATRARLQSLLLSDLSFPVDVYLAGSETAFDSLVGGRFPEWGAAAAIPFLKRIVIKSPGSFSLKRPLRELLSHEYAHLALAHRTSLHSPPRWFDEGFAMVVSMEWSWTENLAMNLAAVTGDFVSLREIDRVNRFGRAKARLAYAESYLAVKYLFDTYGTEAVNLFLDEIARGSSMDRALMTATGSNYADFEREMRIYLQGRFNLVGLLADTMYLWLGLAVIVIIGFVLTVLRRKRYYRKWEEEEKLSSTDFDYGDPDRPERIDDDEPWRQ